MALGHPRMWDTHLHCFDPARYPFKATRTYTPAPAPLDELVTQSQATRLVLVQASVEDGPSGLMAHLARIQSDHPHLLARGIICMDEHWIRLKPEDFDIMHNLGVRYARIHGFLGTDGTDLSSLQGQMRSFARSYPAKRWNWGLSAQLPLKTWAALKESLVHDEELRNIIIIADHVGCATPADIGSEDLEGLSQLLQAGRLCVKISALYRRSPGHIREMKPIILRFADLAQTSLIWGSDYPHVDSSNRGNGSPVEKPQADVPQEIRELQTWLTKEQFNAMMVDNAERLFGH